MQDNRKSPKNRPESEPSSGPAPYRAILLSMLQFPLELAIGFGVAMATTIVLSGLVVAWLGLDSGIAGALFGTIAFIVGGVVGIVFIILVFTRHDPKARRLLDIAGLLFALLGYVVPVSYQGYARRADEQARVERAAAAEKAHEIALNAWLDNMKQTGQHGPPGMVPPMVSVENDGNTVKVRNKSDKKIVVALARVREDSTVPGGWKGCSMFTKDRGGGELIFTPSLERNRQFFSRTRNVRKNFVARILSIVSASGQQISVGGPTLRSPL